MTSAENSLPSQTMAHIKPVTMRDQVYDEIREAILERRLKPGDRVQERKLTHLLNISRTPVREALGLLDRDGLVCYFPNRGWFVMKFTPPEITEIFVIRSGLENLAADLMIDRLSEEHFAELEARIEELGRVIAQNQVELRNRLGFDFNRRLVEWACNKRLLHMWKTIAVQCSMVLNYHTVTMPDYDHWQAVRDRKAILNALRSRDPAAVHAVNNEINDRVVEECIKGFLAAESQKV